MSVTNELIAVTAIIAVVVALVVGVVYLRFGNGLAFRQYAFATPVAGLCGVLGVILGKLGLSVLTGLAIIGPGAIAVIVTLALLYRVVVKSLSEHAEMLGVSTTQLAATAKQSATTAAQQSSMVAEVSTTIEEIHQTSSAASEGAQAVVVATTDAVEQSRQGQSAAADALRIMELISHTSSVVDTVNELAEQSNLLAVNASIEAAKAGEHGRGFAVVAAEVRSLAEQSKAATRQIREAITRTDEGRAAVQSLRDLIDQLVAVLDETSEQTRTIAGAALQQSTGIRQIKEAMASVDQGGKDSASAAKQIEQAVVGLEGTSHELRLLVEGSRGSSTSTLERSSAAA